MPRHLAGLTPNANEEEEGKAVGGLFPGQMLCGTVGQVLEESGFSSHRIPGLTCLCNGHFLLLVSSQSPYDVYNGNLEEGYLSSQKSLSGHGPSR